MYSRSITYFFQKTQIYLSLDRQKGGNMNTNEQNTQLQQRIKDLEKEVSELKDRLFYAEITTKDLTEQKQYFETIAHFAHDWEFWLTPDKKFNYNSPSCLDLTGFTAEEISTPSFNWTQLIFPPDLDKFEKHINDAIEFLSLDQELEFRILTRTKQIIWCEIKSRPVYDSRGKYLGLRASVRNITRLKNALGHIKQLSESKTLETKAKTRYKDELEMKERELVTSLLLFSQKNALINYLKKQLQGIKTSTSPAIQQKIENMLSKIIGSTVLTTDWNTFKVHFEKMHPGFFERLVARYPLLTAKERNLCAYLRLNLSSKEIAGLLNITPESAEIARVRLRKKLKLSREIRLTSFIAQV
jgi:PAS domain S-box-containing protein